jgi:Flp pilus assembly protein CpaB
MVISSWSLNRRWQRLRRPLAVALIAVGGFLIWVRGNAPVTTIPTVVALAEVAAGDTVEPSDVHVVQWPADTHPPPAATDTTGIVGRRAAAAIRAGEPLTEQRVLGPSLLAASGAHLVAVALPLDPLSCSGLVRPGDRVHLVGRAGTGPRTLVRDAPVLTVSTQTGAVVAVPDTSAAVVVEAAALDAIALVLAQA